MNNFKFSLGTRVLLVNIVLLTIITSVSWILYSTTFISKSILDLKNLYFVLILTALCHAIHVIMGKVRESLNINMHKTWFLVCILEFTEFLYFTKYDQSLTLLYIIVLSSLSLCLLFAIVFNNNLSTPSSLIVFSSIGVLVSYVFLNYFELYIHKQKYLPLIVTLIMPLEIKKSIFQTLINCKD